MIRFQSKFVSFFEVGLFILSLPSSDAIPEPQIGANFRVQVAAELPFWLGTGGNVTGRWTSNVETRTERLVSFDDNGHSIFDSLAQCDDSKHTPFRVTKACTPGAASCICRRTKGCSVLDLRILNNIAGTFIDKKQCDNEIMCARWRKQFSNWEIDLMFEDSTNLLRSVSVKNLWEVKFSHDEDEQDASKAQLYMNQPPCEESASTEAKSQDSLAVDILFPLREAVRLAKKTLNKVHS